MVSEIERLDGQREKPSDPHALAAWVKKMDKLCI
jgi:hypothetical protein